MPLPSQARSSWEDLHEMYIRLPDFQRERLARMGFGHFLEIVPFEIHLGLLVSFAERFHSASSSFILRVGEMMITLEDVVRLVGLRIDGEPMVVVWQPCYGDELEACYGMRPPCSGHYHTHVNIRWLKEHLDDLLLADVAAPGVADQ